MLDVADLIVRESNYVLNGERIDVRSAAIKAPCDVFLFPEEFIFEFRDDEDIDVRAGRIGIGEKAGTAL